ncbi:hypothetical protein EV361DRAFT_945157 [Lentinula raphanica]|nr:hypothetical protein EV361DRAFT_945157 [Lentinula raphanica]
MHFTESSKSQNADKTLVEVSSGSTGTGRLATHPAKSKDEDFYYHCRIFQVENCLFRLPIQFLAAHSSYFQNLKVESTDGFTEENPIDLNGVSREDFRQLLKILCSPRNFKICPEALSLTDWEAVLRLATKWEMKEVKMHAVCAVENLSNVDPVDKIVLAQTYDIDPWLTPSFNEILQRPQSLTENDVEKLGVPAAALVEISSSGEAGDLTAIAQPGPLVSSHNHLSLVPASLNQVVLPTAREVTPTAKHQDTDFCYDCRTFLVDECLFRFPIEFLAAQSSHFQDMADKLTDGLTRENPIILNGISWNDFRQLLRVLCFPRNFKSEPEVLSFPQWEAVLRLSKKWGMNEVKTHAISTVEKLPNLAPAFNDILQRSRSLTEGDVEKLGVPTAVRLMGLRDRLCPSVSEKGVFTLNHRRIETDVDFTSLVWDTFPDSRSKIVTREMNKRITSIVVTMTRDSPAFSASNELLFEMIRTWSTRVELHTKPLARLRMPNGIMRINSHCLQLTFNDYYPALAFMSTMKAFCADIPSFSRLSFSLLA